MKDNYIYCDLCGFKPVYIEPPRLDATGKSIFGDVMCSQCHLVIGTIRYDFRLDYLPVVEKEYNDLTT